MKVFKSVVGGFHAGKTKLEASLGLWTFAALGGTQPFPQ